MPALAPVLREDFGEEPVSGVDVGDGIVVATGGGVEALKRSRRLDISKLSYSLYAMISSYRPVNSMQYSIRNKKVASNDLRGIDESVITPNRDI